MASTRTKIGHGLAKVLGIDLHYRNETGSDRITRGESVFSVGSADTYVEDEPTALEWLQSITPSGQQIAHYFIRLFPFLQWITRYNLQWLIGDLVAGLCYCLPATSILCAEHRRHHCRRSSRSSEYGIRKARPTRSGVWSLFILHGRPHLLVFRDFERYHNRGT